MRCMSRLVVTCEQPNEGSERYKQAVKRPSTRGRVVLAHRGNGCEIHEPDAKDDSGSTRNSTESLFHGLFLFPATSPRLHTIAAKAFPVDTGWRAAGPSVQLEAVRARWRQAFPTYARQSLFTRRAIQDAGKINGLPGTRDRLAPRLGVTAHPGFPFFPGKFVVAIHSTVRLKFRLADVFRIPLKLRPCDLRHNHGPIPDVHAAHTGARASLTAAPTCTRPFGDSFHDLVNLRSSLHPFLGEFLH